MNFLEELDKRHFKYTFGEIYRHFYPALKIYVRFPVKFNLTFYFEHFLVERFSFQVMEPYGKELFCPDKNELLSKVDNYLKKIKIDNSESIFYKDAADNSEQLSLISEEISVPGYPTA